MSVGKNKTHKDEDGCSRGEVFVKRLTVSETTLALVYIITRSFQTVSSENVG